MTSIVFTGANTVELLVIELAQSLTAFRICPYPILKTLLDKFLLRLSDSSFFFVQHGFLFTVRFFNIIEDTNILQVQSFLNDLVSVDTACAVGVVRFDISSVIGLALNIPFSRVLREVELDIPLCISRSSQELKDKLLNDFRGQPSCTKTDRDFACGQVFRLHLFKCFHVDFVIIGTEFCGAFRPSKFLTDITGKVFIRHKILRFGTVAVAVHRVQEDNAL